ncbi:MAG: hypothetical protein WD035_11280 [Balneolaceae bacterium]
MHWVQIEAVSAYKGEIFKLKLVDLPAGGSGDFRRYRFEHVGYSLSGTVEKHLSEQPATNNNTYLFIAQVALNINFY